MDRFRRLCKHNISLRFLDMPFPGAVVCIKYQTRSIKITGMCFILEKRITLLQLKISITIFVFVRKVIISSQHLLFVRYYLLWTGVE